MRFVLLDMLQSSYFCIFAIKKTKYKPISNMIPSIMPNVKDGDSLIKEADKIWKDAEEKINLDL